MDITEFFQQSVGKWFAHRTTQSLYSKQSQGSKSDLYIEVLPQADSTVIALCQQQQVDPGLALLGVRLRWKDLMALSKADQEGTALLVPLTDPDSPNQGRLLRQAGRSSDSPAIGRYSMGSDDALTLIIESDSVYSEERLWFASPNLRLRTSVVKRSGQISMTSFCSEIRMREEA